MATFTSSWRSYGSGGQWRLVLEIDDPPSSPGASVSLSARLRLQTTHSLSDSTNTNALSGTLGSSSGSASVSHGSGGGTTTVRTVGPTSVTAQYGQSVTVSVTGSVSGYEALGSASVSGSVTIPARPISPPAPPGSAFASRNSDTSHTITWNRNNPGDPGAPYQYQRVLRREYTTAGGWTDWVYRSGNLSASATSYTDSTTGDRRYQWRVRAFNTAGWSQSAASNALSTTPAAPSHVSATRSGTSATVTWRNNARVAGGVQVQRREDGGAWLTVTTLPAGTTSWTHSSPNPAVTHQYRVRATVAEPILGSAWATSNIVQLAAPPNAPTGLSGPVIRDAADDVTWTWVHNPVDSSAQRQFELRHRPAGGSWTTVGPVASGVSSWILPGGTYPNPVTVEWQVRTWGQHVDPSPWSATASSPTSARPSVLVNDPADGSTVGTSSLTVTWGYDDAEASPQAAWQVELVDAADEVRESRSGAGAASQVTLHTVLPDESSWTVRVRAQDGAGLWSPWDEAAFTVAYPSPPVPAVATSWDPETGTVAVEVTNPPARTYEWTGTPHASASVQRDGEGFELRRNLVPNPSFETGLHNWDAHPGYTLTRTGFARAVASGQWAANVGISGAAANQGVYTTPMPGIKPGDWIGVSAAVRRSSGPTHARFRLELRKGSTYVTLLDLPLFPLWTEDNRQNPRPVFAAQVPLVLDVDHVRLWLSTATENGSAPPNGTVHLDDVMLAVAEAEAEALAAVADYFDGDTPSTVPTVSNDLYRSIDGGPEVLIATGVPADTTVTDYAPTVAGTNTYRVEAVSALPSVASSGPVEQVTPQPRDRKSVWLSGGPGFSQVCRASTNITIGETAGRATKVLHRFAGRPHPVETTGEGLHRTLSLDIDLLTGRDHADAASSSPAEWVALAELPGPHLWRDPSGRYLTVALSDVSTNRRPDGQVTGLSLTATQVDDA